MNKIYIFFLIALVLLCSCKSDVIENNNPSLSGKWLLVNISGGIAGDTEYIDTKTESHLISFDDNNTISFFYNDSLINTTGFQIKKGKSIHSTDELDFLIYENGNEPEVISYNSKDTLTIADNNYDGFTRVYIKQ